MMFNITPKIFKEIDKYLYLLNDIGKECEFTKNELICREGEKPDQLFYMVSGLVKCYVLHEGKEVILRLMTDNSAVIAYSGFITGSMSSEYIECLKTCKGFLIPIKKLERMRSDNLEIDVVFRYIAEQHYLSMERRLMMLHHKSSEERYRYFCEFMEKKIVEETPMHCIASCLGITAESFSRMKRNLIN